MKIDMKRDEQTKLDAVIEQSHMNIETSELQNSFIDDNYDAIDEKLINEARANEGYLEEEAFKKLFLSFLELDESDPLVQDMDKLTKFDRFSLLDKKDYISNPYYKNIKDIGINDGKYRLLINTFKPYEAFSYDQTKGIRENNYAEVTPFGFFNEEVSYLALVENNTVWMSITPYEINTMKKAIANAHGKVMTFGLGLGYFAFMASEKEDVEKVTIVESEKEVIDLFTKYLLPQFPHKEKIEIIKGDAFNKMDLAKEYDDLFIDIYHTADDALPLYLKFKRKASKMKLAINIDYWIEESILAKLRRYVIAIIEEYLDGYTDDDYQNVDSENDYLFKVIHDSLKGFEAKSYVEIENLLSDDGLRKLAEVIKF